MNRMLLLSILLVGSGQVYSLDCVDLSFKAPLGLGSVKWQQVGCEKFHLTFLNPDGHAYSELDTIFSNDFVTTEVHDDYEKETNRQRWMWSRDGQTLIHEATIDGVNKSTQVKTLNTFSEVISREKSGKIKHAMYGVIRTESPEGQVSVNTSTEEQAFEPLP